MNFFDILESHTTQTAHATFKPPTFECRLLVKLGSMVILKVDECLAA
jgi:hypothetical protein